MGTAPPKRSLGEPGQASFAVIDPLDEHRAANFRNWESRVPVHAASNDYDLAGLAADPKRLSPVVAYDRPGLGDLTGLDVVHLQCHIGTDTLSLARLGGRVTGVDFSPSALAVARDLATAAGVNVHYVESELYAVPAVLGSEFDLVYTGVGALCWLPDIAGWARVVAALLRPGGRLYLRDAHPMLMTLDGQRPDDVLAVARDLATAAGVEARFVESELYAVPGVLGAEFDLVYTGVGALCWLPDITGWARVVAALLRPGGRLYLRDAHPMLMTLDERPDDLLVVSLPYFEGEAVRWVSDQTYTDGGPIGSPEQFEWNHGLGEIVQAVVDAGLTVTALREHREVEWQALPQMVEGPDGKFRLPTGIDRLPLMFTLEGRRS